MVGRVFFCASSDNAVRHLSADAGNTAGRVLDGEFAEPLSGAERVFV